MIIDDFTPSLIGAAATGWACVAVPAAIPLAAMLITVISDPSAIAHAADRYNKDLAGKAASAKDELAKLVEKHATDDKWSSEDKQAWVKLNLDPHNKALEATAQMNNGIGDSLKSLAIVYQYAGYVSATIGTVMVAAATAVAGTFWLPGANAATEAAATAAAKLATGVTRVVVNGLRAIIKVLRGMMTTLKEMFTSFKAFIKGLKLVGVSGVAGAAGYGAVVLGAMELKNKAMTPVMWPKPNPAAP